MNLDWQFWGGIAIIAVILGCLVIMLTPEKPPHSPPSLDDVPEHLPEAAPEEPPGQVHELGEDEMVASIGPPPACPAKHKAPPKKRGRPRRKS